MRIGHKSRTVRCVDSVNSIIRTMNKCQKISYNLFDLCPVLLYFQCVNKSFLETLPIFFLGLLDSG